jgi:restriction system protein
MWMRLDLNTYRRVHNLIVPSIDGTTQIDHVIVSVYGIFVIETKNMEGWIFGSPHQKTWTQSLFGKKFQFQNPLRQNYRHTRCLAEFLGLDHDLLRSVVFFIRKFTKPVLTPARVTK